VNSLRFLDAAAEPFLLLGMVHLRPLPGSPRWGGSMDEVVEAAARDARALAGAGFDGVIVENYGDIPFEPGAVAPATVAALAACAREVRREIGPDTLLGVNALRSDASAALAAAVAANADLIRVNVHTGAAWTDQGLIQGQAHRTLRERRQLGSDVAILADVLVKHAQPVAPADPAVVARETVERGSADGLVVTGPATGAAVDLERLRAVVEAVPGTPVLAGSGVTPESLPAILDVAAGAIVGTWLKDGGRTDAPVDADRAALLVASARDGRAGPPVRPRGPRGA
jgi:hypothetical protein